MGDATNLTPGEIEQFKEQFKDYPEALEALELIEESDGDLIESANLLMMERKVEFNDERQGTEDNILNKLAKQFRAIVCDDDFINTLMTGLLTGGVATLATSGQISQAVATPVVIYLSKKGVKKWCETNQ